MAREGHRAGSVRFRVTAVATAVVLVVLAVAAVAVVRAQRSTLLDDVDDRLEAAAEALTDARSPGLVPGFDDDEALFQIVAPDGRVVQASPEAGDRPLAAVGGDDDARTVDGVAGEDERFRVLTEELDDGSVVLVAQSLEDVDDSVAALTGTLLAGVPLATAALAVVLWFVVGRTLRPVERLRSEVASIGGADLHRRVPEPPGDDEIARLARTMNGMLDRIESSAALQQRFVADASHELRSPLTRMRTELEVDLAHPQQSTPEATHRSVLAETIGLQHLVDDLLHLARADAGVDGHRRDAVRLDELVHRAVAGRHIDVQAVEGPTVVLGRADHLRRLVTNLLDNAERHARARITVSLAPVGDGVELAVADDGPGIAAADAERVFERFTRLDDARSAGAGGTGLGLAIVREIADAHGGSVAVTTDPTLGGARFVVRLPAR